MISEEQIEKMAQKVTDKLKLIVATEKFKKELRMRSFSGRNPELGKMTNCPACGLRHRETQCHRKSAITYANKPGTTEPMVAETKGFRLRANPYGWRAKPGKFMWIPELKKFLNLTQ